MSSDYRALCEDLIDALESNHQTWRIPVSPLIARARAVLAEPVAEGPTSGAYINKTTRRVFFNNPATIAECGGPCAEGGPEACDRGALWHDEPVAEGPTFDDLSELCSEHGLDVDDWPLEKFEALWEVARAVLARYSHQPAPPAEGKVAERPSDEELLELMPQQFREDLATVSRMAAHDAGAGVKPGLLRVSLNTGALDYARAVLARYSHQPAPPAEGEVGELVAWIRGMYWAHPDKERATRAADLLEQRHPAPVPERLPELRGMFERILCVARSSGQRPVGNIQLADRLISAVVSWSALPLPQGEVE